MGYNLDYSSIRDLQTSAMTSVENWKNDCNTISQDISALIADSGFTGAGADKLKCYLMERHIVLTQLILAMLTEYNARFALYVDGMYQYDSNKYASINEDAVVSVIDELKSEVSEMDDVYQTVVNRMNGLNEPDIITSLQNEERYMINFQNEISKLGTFREDLGTYDRECNDGLADLKEMMSIVLNAVKQLSDEGIIIPDEYEPGSMFDGLTADRLRILLDRSGRFLEENETEIESAYQHYTDIWNDIIEELREQRIEKGLNLVLVSVVAIGATVLTFGALGPEMISVETAVLGSFALCFDVSSLTEGSLELYYGCTGDVETVAFNPIRDTYFFGWQEGYDAAAFGVNMGFGYCSAVDLAVASEIRTESVLLEDIGGGGKTNFENEIPRSGSEWDAYFRGKYGDENVVWESNRGRTTVIHNDILDSPRAGSALKVDDVNPIYEINEKTGRLEIVKEFPATAQAHGFNDIVDNYAGYATKTPLENATLYQLDGSLNGISGRFEWIIQNGQVTHRMFIQNGTMNGVPIKP